MFCRRQLGRGQRCKTKDGICGMEFAGVAPVSLVRLVPWMRGSPVLNMRNRRHGRGGGAPKPSRLLAPAFVWPPRLEGATGETGHDCRVVRRFCVSGASRLRGGLAW